MADTMPAIPEMAEAKRKSRVMPQTASAGRGAQRPAARRPGLLIVTSVAHDDADAPLEAAPIGEARHDAQRVFSIRQRRRIEGELERRRRQYLCGQRGIVHVDLNADWNDHDGRLALVRE